MQQQIQIHQRPEQVLNEAANFFAKRRAKVTDRTERGFRFGLQGGPSEEGGRVTAAPGPGGVCTVTVQADGLGVMAIAEGFVRELRKQARDQGRSAQRGQRADAGTMRGDFSGLRERLGMPPPERPPRPPQRQAPPDRAPEPVDTTPVDIAPPPPQAAAAEEPGTSGAAGATTVAPDESLPADVQARSAEDTGGVPAPEDAQVGPPSETAKAHSGAGSPQAPPALDPSVPPSAVDSRQ